jgi:hypothetical protein
LVKNNAPHSLTAVSSFPSPGSASKVKTDKSEGVPASCGLSLRRTWNAAWESLYKFVSPELFQKIYAIKKKSIFAKNNNRAYLLCTRPVVIAGYIAVIKFLAH